MRNSAEFMDEFMRTWQQMKQNQNITLDILVNYDDLERAFREEKKVAVTYAADEILEEDIPNLKLILKK